MKSAVAILSVFLLTLPVVTYALACNEPGYTVIYVNGIQTNKQEAGDDTDSLRKVFEDTSSIKGVKFTTGYNESHLGSGGDIIQSAVQILGHSFSELDKNTILMEVHPQVSTQKILLLGHSQGTFYSNAMYKYLTDNGVPAESITVYNLATPADRVEGGGAYLTSANDRFINAIRRIMILSDKQPLPANINIPIPENESKDAFGGHHFQSDYLTGATDEIVSDMEGALRGLKAGVSTASEGCFTPPPKSLGYKAEAVTFKVADSALQMAGDGVTATGKAMVYGTVVTGKAIVYTAVVTGKAIVFAADVTARAIIAAAQKASAAANAVATQLRNIFASASTGNTGSASQLAAAALVLTTQPKTNATAAPVSTPPSAPAKTASIPPTEVIAKAPVPPPVVAGGRATKSTDSPVDGHPPVHPQIQPQILTPPVFGPALVSVVPGFGGGGASAPAPVQSAPTAATIIPLTVETPLEGALFATSSVTFTGTTTPGYSVVASYESTAVATAADADGNWSIALTVPEGATSIGVVATDSDGNTSDAITRTINVDTTPANAPSASVSECTASLSASFCLIATTAVTLSWPTVSGAEYYAYAINGGTLATTTGTSAALSLTASASSTISVASYDAAGNAATSTIDAYVLTQPLIINEIAWAGTLAETTDEWIELKNNSSYALDLSRVAVVSADSSPYMQLSGTIASGGYYLIERRAEATSATGDLIFAFEELSQDGEKLELLWGSGSATTTLDSTPAVSVCGGWCSGIAGTFWGPVFTPHPMTMERKAGTDGTVAASWQRGISAASPATDASGNTISGTPRAENSEGGEIPPPTIPPLFGDG